MKLKNVLNGRNGIDQLNIFLLVITLIMAVTTFINESNDLKTLCWFPFLLCIYRMLSKKRIARYKENIRFMRLINPILKRIYINERKMKDKQHKYCQCPSCS